MVSTSELMERNIATRYSPYAIVAVWFFSACTQGNSTESLAILDPPFCDVTLQNLPKLSSKDRNMDARPIDIELDGDIDIVVAREFQPNIVLVNDGSGKFSIDDKRLNFAARDSEDIGVGDFDLDGDPDIIIVNEDDKSNELYINNGAGYFRDASEMLPTAGVSNAVVVADFDAQSGPDIMIGNNGQNVLLINTGRGGFTDDTSERMPNLHDVTQDLEFGDIDLDGDLDILVGNEDANRILINVDGVFHDESKTRLPLREEPEETREADLGDVDGDGDLDILFANVSIFTPLASVRNRLLINDGHGYFIDDTENRLPRDYESSFDGDFFDIDADGDLDIATANANRHGRLSPGSYRIYLNDGSGQFLETTNSILPAGTTGVGIDIEFADFNGDNLHDIYLVGRRSTDRLLIRCGSALQ